MYFYLECVLDIVTVTTQPYYDIWHISMWFEIQKNVLEWRLSAQKWRELLYGILIKFFEFCFIWGNQIEICHMATVAKIFTLTVCKRKTIREECRVVRHNFESESVPQLISTYCRQYLVKLGHPFSMETTSISNVVRISITSNWI